MRCRWPHAARSGSVGMLSRSAGREVECSSCVCDVLGDFLLAGVPHLTAAFAVLPQAATSSFQAIRASSHTYSCILTAAATARRTCYIQPQWAIKNIRTRRARKHTLTQCGLAGRESRRGRPTARSPRGMRMRVLAPAALPPHSYAHAAYVHVS